MKDIESMTNDLMNEQKNELPSIQSVCEDHFDLWEKELFPVLKDRNKSCYKAVANMLTKKGYKNVQAGYISKCFIRIRNKRGLK